MRLALNTSSNVDSGSCCHARCPNSIQVMFSSPFRLSLTELITNVDISGNAPLSDALETAVYNRWTGLVDWTSGLDYWTDLFSSETRI